jgi:Na+-transporting methylmalonyl-CoA/oxaloacetate decarboxylase gamma subunit
LNNILEGVSLSIAGISVTFAALGLLILAMIVLERAFRHRSPQVSDEKEPEETSPSGYSAIASTLERYTSHGDAGPEDDEEVAAAIAVALAYLRSLETGQSELGTALEAGHGSWWMMGQIQYLAGTRMGPIRPHLSGTTQQGRR